MRIFSIRPVYGLLMTSAFVLAACSMSMDGSSEDLLSAEGEWKIVEEERSASPMQDHLDSRNKVHPNDVSSKRSYTKSVNNMNLDEEIHFRVLRLERQMDGVRSDLDKIVPKIMAMPEATDAQSPKAKVKPAKKVAAIKPAKKAKVAKAVKIESGGPLRVTRVRTGAHTGKTRLVLDMSGAGKMSYDLDNAEKLLIVELPGAGWSAPLQQSFKNDAYIKGYSAQVEGDKVQLIVELKKAAKITMAQAYKPNSTYGHRLVLDIAGE